MEAQPTLGSEPLGPRADSGAEAFKLPKSGTAQELERK